MWDIGLCWQVWQWAQSKKRATMGVQSLAGGLRERFKLLADRHWPTVCKGSVHLSHLMVDALFSWKDCATKGLLSLVSLGVTAVFVAAWGFFLYFTSTTCISYSLLSLVAARAAIDYLGYTPGLLIAGSFGILIMWMNGYFWITGFLLIAGGYICSLKYAQFLILVLTAYAIYCVSMRVGWLGVALTLNLSFISNDILNKVLQGSNDATTESTDFEEPQEPETPIDDFYRGSEYYSSSKEPESVSSTKSFCSEPTPDVLLTQKDTPSTKVVKTNIASSDEINRILNGLNHYDVLGIPRNKAIDLSALTKEYRKKVLLVHPDKNLGNQLACESFKKLQCAYEVLKDCTKKTVYDEKLRKEESGRVSQRFHGSSHQNVEFLSEESRQIECTKCGNFHTWICTKRNKTRARWCQGCLEYHQARDGDGWVENGCSPWFAASHKVDIPRAFVCAESKIFDVSDWAACQGMECKPNTHRPTFMVNMVGLDRSSQRSQSSRYPWGLDAEMIVDDDEFELWLQQALASGYFSETPKRRKSWTSPFKLPQKGMKHWRKSP